MMYKLMEAAKYVIELLIISTITSIVDDWLSASNK